MNKRTALLLCPIILFLAVACKKETVINPEILSKVPSIYPDYMEVTVPVTIAPLNFKLKGQYERLNLTVKGGKTGIMELQSSTFIAFPENKWRRLLSDNINDKIVLTLSVKSSGGWKQYAPFNIYISGESIDYGLAYRLIAPAYEIYSKMGIYQRNLSTFAQSPVIENTVSSRSCINCHSFNQTNPDNMSLHIRGANGGTIIKNAGGMKIVDTKTEENIGACVYPYWHPSGRFIAYSVNRTQQIFRSVKDELIEVLDLASDIVVYDLEEDELLSCDLLRSSDFETFPSFSADGKTLYFCRALEQKLPENYREVRYNLCSISFNAETKTFGSRIDTVILADVYKKSVSFPKPSFDGKYIMYALLDYGNFGIWHKESDLYLLDLSNGSSRELSEVNSPGAESYHNWSSNSRWFVFGSRRDDGLYTRPYIAAMDENGRTGKPFLLPQRNPDSYLESLYSYNVPEFISKPIRFDVIKAEKIINSPTRKKLSFQLTSK